MRVFLSWSGTASGAIAETLVDWLPLVVPPTKPWVSAHHIRPGKLWDLELTKSLRSTNCAILILTKDNQTAPWLLYEAGVLSRSSRGRQVIPYRIDLPLDSVASPLARFQGFDATKAGTRRLVESLNSIVEEPIPEKRLHQLFDVFWPKLQSDVKSALQSANSKAGRVPDTNEYLREILGLLRARADEVTSPAGESPQEALGAVQARIASLSSTIASMETYERKGGVASTESWWNPYVERHREAHDLYQQALDLLKRAANVRLST
jgi:hypothetical protein